MLQQTRVETVLPYYNRFVEKFPTVAALAGAEIDEVLALWSGLGYYRRARQLHAAADQVADGMRAGRGFPRTVDELRELPGIGAYTAAAIASIAFGVDAPVLDGNVERVLSRWLALGCDPKSGPARERLLEAAAGLLVPERPGDGNQALMELGATICVPKRPRCLLCPIRSGCVGAAQGDPERYPVARPKRERERRRMTVAVAEKEGRVLLFRRPDASPLLAGTWELPWIEEQEKLEEALCHALRRALDARPAGRDGEALDHLPRPGGRGAARRGGGCRAGVRLVRRGGAGRSCRCRRWSERCCGRPARSGRRLERPRHVSRRRG